MKPYLIFQNKKIYAEREKEYIFRVIWSNALKINPKETQRFDQYTDTLVSNFVHKNHESMLTLLQDNPNDIGKSNHLTAKIATEDIQMFTNSA